MVTMLSSTVKKRPTNEWRYGFEQNDKGKDRQNGVIPRAEQIGPDPAQGTDTADRWFDVRGCMGAIGVLVNHSVLIFQRAAFFYCTSS